MQWWCITWGLSQDYYYTYSHPSSLSPHSDSPGRMLERKHQWKTYPSAGLPPGRYCGRSWWSSEREAVSCPGTLSHVLDQLLGCLCYEESCSVSWRDKELESGMGDTQSIIATWEIQQRRVTCIQLQIRMICSLHCISCKLGNRNHASSLAYAVQHLYMFLFATAIDWRVYTYIVLIYQHRRI